MTNTFKTMTAALLMVGLLFFDDSSLLAQTRDVVQSRLEIDNAMVKEGNPAQEYTDFENGMVDAISGHSITVAGKQFLLSSYTLYYDWEGNETGQNRFAVGNLVVVTFRPMTMEALEVRMDEEQPGTDEHQQDDIQASPDRPTGGDMIRLENGVYVN